MKRRRGKRVLSLLMALVLVATTSAWSQPLEAKAVFEEPDALSDHMEAAPEQSVAEEEVPDDSLEEDEAESADELGEEDESETPEDSSEQGTVEAGDMSGESAVAKTGSAELRDQVFSWDNATVYFVLTDRFLNADKSNDNSYGRGMQADGKTPVEGLDTYTNPGTFHGGDLKGLTQKVEEGYFNKLGVNAIWITAPYEQIHGYTSGNKRSNNANQYPDPEKGGFPYYSYHGYWTLDYSQIDANMGTEKDFEDFVDSCHEHGIRVVMDVVMNHVGYVTMQDAVDYGFEGALKGDWRTYYYGNATYLMGGDPESETYWDKTSSVWSKWWGPAFVKADYPGYTAAGGGDIEMSLCGLPDVRTSKSAPEGETPPLLVNKWTSEGRLSKEQGELDAYFSRTGNKKQARYYIIKWLTDWVREYGVDGFRCDTAKHVDVDAWKDLKTEAVEALKEWRKNNPGKPGAQWTDDFWMTGEAWGHGMGRSHYYDNGFDSMINFTFPKGGTPSSMEGTYSSYAKAINSDPTFNSLSYISSHDDCLTRGNMIEAGTDLLLAPGAVQIYYGDESNRPIGWESWFSSDYTDQKYRTDMNWDSMDQKVLSHWQKVGQFRNNHLSVGAGQHEKLSDSPYTFSRTYHLEEEDEDKVVVALPNTAGKFDISVGSVFEEGETLTDAYSGKTCEVTGGKVSVTCDENGVILLQGSGIVKASVNAKTKNNATTYSADTFDITLRANKAVNTYYSINGGTKIPYENDKMITIGGDTKYGEETTLTLTGTSEEDGSSLTKTIVYSRSAEPTISDGVFCVKVKKSDFSTPPNIYVYSNDAAETEFSGPWPGPVMTADDDPDYYSYTNEDIAEDACIILSLGATANSGGTWRSTPDKVKGLVAKGSMLYDKTANALTELPSGEPGKVTINYKTEGGTILKSIYRVGVVGKPYKTYPAAISGYTLKTTPANATGTFEANVEVNYIYSSGDTPVGDINITSFTAAPGGSVYQGNSVSLTASATGGTAPLQYEFTALQGSRESTIRAYGADNTATWTPQTAGTYTLKVSVKDSGGKSGTKTIANYEVKENAVGDINITSFTAAPNGSVYQGEPVSLTADATGGTAPLQYEFTARQGNGTESTIRAYGAGNTATWTPQTAGTYTLKVSVKDSGGKSGTKTIANYEVKARQESDIQIFFKDETKKYVYNGKEQKPEVTVKDGTRTLTEGTDYTLSYDKCRNAGDKDSGNAPTVIVQGQGDYAGKIINMKLTFTIEKADIPDTAPKSAMTAAAGPVTALQLSAGWEWLEKDAVLKEEETISVSAVYNGADKANYKTTTVSVSLTGISSGSCQHTDLEKVVGEAPDCTNSGYYVTKCKQCQKIIGERVENIAPLGHSGGIAACRSRAICDTCGEEYGSWNDGNHVNRVVQNKKEANCQQEGSTGDVVCKDCGSLISPGKPLAKTEHVWDEGKVTKAATATEDGIRTFTCTLCGGTKTETIPKTGGGSTQEPGESLKVGEEITDTASKGLYKVTQSDSTTKTVEFVYTTATSKTVSVPNAIVVKGTTYQVTAIAANAFLNKKNVTSIRMGSNIKTIGNNAFSGCSKLKKVTLSKNTTTIGNNAFYKCTSLTSITIPAKVSKIGSKAFYGCKKLKKITIKTTKLTSKKVGKQAFKGIAQKATIKVPKTKLTAYKKFLKTKGVGSKAKIKK